MSNFLMRSVANSRAMSLSALTTISLIKLSSVRRRIVMFSLAADLRIL